MNIKKQTMELLGSTSSIDSMGIDFDVLADEFSLYGLTIKFNSFSYNFDSWYALLTVVGNDTSAMFKLSYNLHRNMLQCFEM